MIRLFTKRGYFSPEQEFKNDLGVDEELLRAIAETTGGKYFHASDSKGLTEVYGQIDQLEKSQFEESKFSEYTELFRWLAGSGMVLIVAVGVLRETRFRSLP